MKKSYYAVIPADVRYDKILPMGARMLYGELTALANEKGYCWATNNYFAELYGVTTVTVSNWIAKLEKRGYINREIIYKKDSKEVAERRIYITTIKENFNTSQRNFGEGIKENFKDPIKENFKENTTVLNNTFNSTSSGGGDDVFEFYQQNFGTISPFIRDYILSLVKDYGEELTLEAMKVAVENKARTIKYVNTVLGNWAAKGIKTAADVKAAENERIKDSNRSTKDRSTRKIENISGAPDIEKINKMLKEMLE